MLEDSNNPKSLPVWNDAIDVSSGLDLGIGVGINFTESSSSGFGSATLTLGQSAGPDGFETTQSPDNTLRTPTLGPDGYTVPEITN